MKKVFAILSALALMIALVGAVTKTNSVVKADRKIVVDPTLSENEIPMYIMNSIYTTFPNYYDNETEPDKNWPGASRMYPWNETKLQVKLMDDNGAFTGQEYAVYFSGGLNPNSGGAGYNLVFVDVVDGAVVGKRMDAGKVSNGGAAMDPSLSHMRTNLADVPATFDPLELLGSTEGSQFLNRVLVFDADGRMVRGLMGNPGYLAADAEGALDNVFAPEYCYVDGVVTKFEEGVVCDKVKEAVLDDNGDPVLDDQGEPTYQDTDKDNFLYTRFLWQWVSSDEFDPDTVNTVPYLSEGWDATKWDYANFEESSNGYVLICFLPSENSSVKLTAEQIAAYGEAEAPAERTCAKLITIPAHGYSYDFGYLDKGITALYNNFVDMFHDGYYFGRTVDANGKGMGSQRTFDFSASPLYVTDKVVNGVSFQAMDGQNTIEVLQGETIVPANNVVYTGMSKYWAVENDLTSYKADPSVLDMVIKVNGITVVQPSTGYTSFQDMVDDFMKDLNDTLKKVKGDDYVEIPTPQPGSTCATGDPFYVQVNYQLLGTSTPSGAVINDADFQAKWIWLLKYIAQECPALGIDTEHFTVGSPGNFMYTLYHFLIQDDGQMSGWPANKMDWSNGAASKWLDPRTNLEKWNDCSIDTSMATVDTNYVVEFVVTNAQTGNSSELKLTYVVVDEYTPILKVNKNNLIFTPIIEGEKVVVKPIDKFTFCTAYNGAYNGVDIRGDVISYKVHYESETLDFDNPTEGEHHVKATVYSASGAKFVSKEFVVSIEDMTAPRVFTRDLVLAYGSYYTPTLGVTFAFDAVDGNLMDNNFRGWWSDVSKTIVNVSKPGNYTQVLEISDTSGNVTQVSYKVTILPAPAAADLSDDLDEVADSVAALKQSLSEVKELVEALQTEVNGVKTTSDAIKTDVAGLKTDVNTLKANTDTVMSNTAKCGSKSALLVEFLAAVSLLGVFLKKRH